MRSAALTPARRSRHAGQRVRGARWPWACSRAEATARHAKFGKANLMQSSFEDAKLDGANFRGANLHQAETWRAELGSAMLEGALLSGTKLGGK